MAEQRELTRLEREHTLYQLDGYFTLPSGEQTPEQNFEAAKAELIEHLERNIKHVELTTFEMFAAERRKKRGFKS